MSLVTDTLGALLAPIQDDLPAGHFDPEDETYQAIDHEMVKLGGLQERTLDWAFVEEAAHGFLSAQCKHWRIVVHLTTVRLRQNAWPDWVAAIALVAGMVERYWETSYPKPDPTGYLAKRKQVGLLIERLGDALGQLDVYSFNPDHLANAQRALATLQGCAQSAKLDVAALSALSDALRKRAEQAVLPTPVSSPAPGQGGGSLNPAFFAPRREVPLGNERDSRRALLAMAEYVNQQDPYDPAGYQLRRFGLWSSIHAAPVARQDRRTELTGVPVDTVDSYQELLANNALDPVLLQRLEKSVVSSPYWLRGSFLSATLASRLEMQEVAAAIRQATERFVRRVPALQELCFNDGRPFVDDQTLGWLAGADAGDGAGAALPEYASLRDELITQLNQEGVEVVLLRLQALHSQFSAPRQRCHATVIAADLLASRGLSWIAHDLYANVDRIMRSTSADQWEPDLYSKLAQHGAALPAQNDNPA
jgi:type VI secretion system protein VasJ